MPDDGPPRNTTLALALVLAVGAFIVGNRMGYHAGLEKAPVCPPPPACPAPPPVAIPAPMTSAEIQAVMEKDPKWQETQRQIKSLNEFFDKLEARKKAGLL